MHRLPVISLKTEHYLQRTKCLLESINMLEHEKINYVEFPAKDIEAVKTFFSTVFNWTFTDYGPDYTAFSNQGIDGGFFKSDLWARTENGSALIVFYNVSLERTLSRIENAD